MDKSREQFEAWAKSKWDGELGSKGSDGNYHFEPVQLQWEGWQASRAAVEIELPHVFDHWLGREDFICVLQSDGLKVKQ